MKEVNLSLADVMRRVEFILTEARQRAPRYDQVVRMAFRVVSNYQSVGRDCGSEYIYRASRLRSEQAHNAILEGREKGCLHNEHQEPLKAVWNWIVDRGDVTSEELYERLLKWPMVVITREENRSIPRSDEPITRYKHITVLVREEDGRWRPRDGASR